MDGTSPKRIFHAFGWLAKIMAAVWLSLKTSGTYFLAKICILLKFWLNVWQKA